MSKLGGLFRTAIRSNLAVRTTGPSSDHPFSAAAAAVVLRETSRRFSTGSDSVPQDAAADAFLRTQSPGSVYGRLTGNNVTKNTLRTDIIHLLEGCGLTLDDVKVEYNRMYNPTSVMVHFSSSQDYNRATREIGRKGRLYKIERVGQAQWNFVMPHGGKTVLLQGLPREAVAEDVERFLSGCEYDASSIQIFFRPPIPDKLATVRFPSQTQAMNCFIMKNKGFCLNNQVLVRVLH